MKKPKLFEQDDNILDIGEVVIDKALEPGQILRARVGLDLVNDSVRNLLWLQFL